MRRYLVLVVAVALVLPALALARQIPGPAGPPEPPEQPPTVVQSWKHAPPRHKRHLDRFVPDEHPSGYTEVSRITRIEARIHGGPNIINRISCETGGTYDPNAYNSGSGASGLVQFLPSTWASMWPGTPRLVRFATHTAKRKAVIIVQELSDGTYRRRVVRHIRQKITVIHRGLLPRNPSPFHGWAAIRVGTMKWDQTPWDCSI